jgi:uncharacterized protein YegP (UPF0339 family)
MKDHYDFSKAERGKFFIGDEPYDVVIHVDHSKAGAKFEVFHGPDGKYRFRLADKTGTLFTSEEGFASRDACLSAISLIKQESLLAPTTFA